MRTVILLRCTKHVSKPLTQIISLIHNSSLRGGYTYAAAAAAKSLQSCPTLCDLRDGSLPGYPVPGILQARTLEWGAIASPLFDL